MGDVYNDGNGGDNDNADADANDYGDGRVNAINAINNGDVVPVGEVVQPGRPPWHLVVVTTATLDALVLLAALGGSIAPAGRLHRVRAAPQLVAAKLLPPPPRLLLLHLHGYKDGHNGGDRIAGDGGEQGHHGGHHVGPEGGGRAAPHPPPLEALGGSQSPFAVSQALADDEAVLHHNGEAWVLPHHDVLLLDLGPLLLSIAVPVHVASKTELS